MATQAPPTDFRQAGLSSLPVMPRPRYRQDPLPLGECAPEALEHLEPEG